MDSGTQIVFRSIIAEAVLQLQEHLISEYERLHPSPAASAARAMKEEAAAWQLEQLMQHPQPQQQNLVSSSNPEPNGDVVGGSCSPRRASGGSTPRRSSLVVPPRRSSGGMPPRRSSGGSTPRQSSMQSSKLPVTQEQPKKKQLAGLNTFGIGSSSASTATSSPSKLYIVETSANAVPTNSNRVEVVTEESMTQQRSLSRERGCGKDRSDGVAVGKERSDNGLPQALPVGSRRHSSSGSVEPTAERSEHTHETKSQGSSVGYDSYYYGQTSISLPGLQHSRRRTRLPKNLPPFMAHPAHAWYQLWSKLISFAVIFTTLYTPMQVAFMDREQPAAISIVLVVNSLFAIDICITFNLAVDDKGGCITNRAEIARIYAMSGRLLTDVVSTVPWAIIWNYMDGIPGMSRYSRRLTSMLLSLVPLVRMYRILLMLRTMQKDSRFNLLAVVVGKVMLFILICTHTSGCIFYAVAKLEDFDETTWVGTNHPTLPDEHWTSRYIRVLFWAVATLKAGPASGSLYPVNEQEMFLACCAMVVNICLQTYLVSSMSALLTTADLTIYAFRKRLRQVMEFASQRGLPRQLRESVKEYLAFKFSANDELEHDVMSALPELYRQRISHALYRDIIGGMGAFRNCSASFLWQLHGIMHATMQASHHNIIGAGEPATKLYILAKGEVGLYYNDELCETRNTGECIGEVPFICKKVQPFAVNTHVACRVLSINREDWETLVASHPEAGFQIKSNLEEDCMLRIGRLEEGTLQKVYQELLQCIRANMIESKEATAAALCFAAARGDLVEMRRLLIGHTADCADYDLRTPMHLAAANGMVDAITLLIERMGNVNSVDKFGRTPLLEACRSRQLQAGRLLYQQGARLGFSSAMLLESQLPSLLDSVDESQGTVSGGWDSPHDGHRRSVAPRSVSRQIDQISLKSAEMAKNLEGSELCQAAADVEQLWYLHALLQYGADCNAGDYDARTALHVACASGNKPAVQLLLSQLTIDVDPRDNFGRTPLMEAVRHENEPCARLLTARGADHGFIEDLSLATANSVIAGQELCQAAFSNQKAYLFTLVMHCGLNVDAADYDFRTALMLASAEGNSEVAVALVQHKADVHRKDRWGHTALSEARDHGYPELAKLLEQMDELAVKDTPKDDNTFTI